MAWRRRRRSSCCIYGTVDLRYIADKGIAKAQYNLGIMYYNRMGQEGTGLSGSDDTKPLEPRGQCCRRELVGRRGARRHHNLLSLFLLYLQMPCLVYSKPLIGEVPAFSCSI